MVADDKKIEKVGKCHKVKLQIQDFNLESPFCSVPLGGVDVVLGIQWLQTLGTFCQSSKVIYKILNGKGRNTNYMGSSHRITKLYHHPK